MAGNDAEYVPQHIRYSLTEAGYAALAATPGVDRGDARRRHPRRQNVPSYTITDAGRDALLHEDGPD